MKLDQYPKRKILKKQLIQAEGASRTKELTQQSMLDQPQQNKITYIWTKNERKDGSLLFSAILGRRNQTLTNK